jgi:hypothetical protein
MKHDDKKTVCERASVSYYDYIQSAGLCGVDPEIFRHIEKCTFCQGEIERLKVTLVELTDRAITEKTNRRDTQATTILASHFNLMNKEVTCGVAKRFMPSLASLSSDIKIPTPITIHIENCNLCRHDLDTIRKLNLTHEQFTHLGQVIASQMAEHNGEGELSEELIKSLASLDFDNDALAVLKHIIERKESGVTTEYITKRQVSIKSSEDLYNDYKNWPVEIVIHDRKKATTDRIDLTRSLSGHRNRIRQLVKPLAAIAAMIFIAIWLFVGTIAKAVEFDDIYNVIGKIKNICLTSGTSEVEGATQKVWISKDLDIKLFYSANHWILWDVQNRARKSRTSELAHWETNELNDAELMNVRQTMDIPLALLPFQSPHSLPDKYDWKLLPDREVTGQFSNTQVYDLSWSDKIVNGSLVCYRWRAYINKDTLLPERVENWQKHPSAEKYELKNWMDITYPQAYEVKKLIRDIGLVSK